MRTMVETREIAKNIYKLINSGKDKGIVILGVLSYLKDNDPVQVLSEYKKILKGDIQLVEVYTQFKLEDFQKNKLISKLDKYFKDSNVSGDYVVDYNVSETYDSGILIKIGDNMLDGTV